MTHIERRSLSILWAITLSPRHGLRNGATLRFASLAKELVALGHRVSAVQMVSAGPRHADEAALVAALQDRYGIEQFYSVTAPVIPSKAMRRTRLALFPKLRYRLLSRFLSPASAQLEDLIGNRDADALIVGSRQFLPVVPYLSHRPPLLIDWCDSEALARFREARTAIRANRVQAAARHLHAMAQAWLEERAYGREATMNLIASPIDQRWLDRATGIPNSRVIGNGVQFEESAPSPKVPDRLVFSGNMDFPPNYKAAIWFIDHVLPLIWAVRPQVEFHVAGQFPPAHLSERSGGRVRVLGFVDDLRAALASSALYVAPMVSGGGFKNKVLEAIASGTYVAATPMGVEFLPSQIQDQLIVERAPAALALRILDFLSAPERYARSLEMATLAISTHYRWATPALELERAILACGTSHG